MGIHVFGIRHHGPGSARSLVAALEALAPDAVLVEGPPDAHDVLGLISDENMKPPVALLVYPPEEPQKAAYYPFATFSPEWRALLYAHSHGVPARLMDLPRSLALALEDQSNEAEEETLEVREDPIGMLAEAAGYEDRELWWERQVERRRDPTDVFEGILEAMTALREGHEPPPREARREAYMRRILRNVRKEGYEKIAVVCGAWHAPALVERHSVKDDDALLRGLKKTKVLSTWIPWTNERLSYRSGYGAGVSAPGWYEHLWDTPPEDAGARWILRVARLLRDADLDASPAAAIETIRLADALSAMRELPAPGLNELDEAVLTVLCGGERAPMNVLREELMVGRKLGEVPETAPAVPLQKDLERRQKRLRLKPSGEVKNIDLDLRETSGRERSELLHRLGLLGIPWGEQQRVSGKSGTFHEVWTLRWTPELSVDLIEANVWGNTIEAASAARVADLALSADLPELTRLLDAAILARLPKAVAELLIQVRERAASSDVRRLMAALPPLARVARYGNVRGTASTEILPIIESLFERVLVGLPGACVSLDESAAVEMAEGVGAVESAVNLLDRPVMRDEWHAALRPLATGEVAGTHPLVRGWCCRLLLEAGALDGEELQRLARLALSPAVAAPEAAAWAQGILRGSGLVLLHQTGLWRALDSWLTSLTPETFTTLLPLINRAFSGFEPPERRAMGEKVKDLESEKDGKATAGYGDLNPERAVLTLPVLAQILGVEHDG